MKKLSARWNERRRAKEMAGFHQPEANDKVKSDKVSDVGEHIESDDDTS
jgi:hypothetical protein